MERNSVQKMVFMQILGRFWTNNMELINMLEDSEGSGDGNHVGVTYCPTPISVEVIKILSGDEKTCISHLRVNLSSFRCIVQHLDEKRHGWCREIEAIMFLFWVAAGCSYRVVSAAINVPRSTAFHIISKVLKKLLDIIPTAIKYPSEEELFEITNNFKRRGKSNIFIKAAGALDGTYVSVLCPPHLHDEYINRKLQYAIQLQVLCDHSGKFLNIFTGYPGSVHDQRVFRNSPLFLNGEYPPAPYFILADSGYMAITTPVVVVTPYKGTNLSRPQRLFNKHHSMARIIVEKSIGDLKNRWRCLFKDRPIELKIKKAIEVIAVCCALHNICLTNGDVLLNNESSPSTPVENDSGVETSDAAEFRSSLCRELMRELDPNQ